MRTPDHLTDAGRAKLAAARILLHETKGFLYLPVLVRTQAVGAAALAHLLSNGHGVAPFHIAWPHSPVQEFAAPAPVIDEWELARGQLLASLDHAIAMQAKGAILIVDASPSDRHRLAIDSISYLNQRREALRRHQLRLILLWPAGEARALMGGAPDLWSMRALAPVIDAEDLVADNASPAFELGDAPAIHQGAALSASQRRQWQRWQTSRDVAAARLSAKDAFALLEALYEQGEWLSVVELAEGVLRSLRRPESPIQWSDRALALKWLSMARIKQGDRKGALAPARESVEIREKLAAENFAAHAPDLATSLSNLSGRLAESGDRAGGLTAIRRAVGIREQLAAENFAAYAPDLAASLNNLAGRLAESGDRAGGLAAVERAIELITPFATPGTVYADWLSAMQRGRKQFG